VARSGYLESLGGRAHWKCLSLPGESQAKKRYRTAWSPRWKILFLLAPSLNIDKLNASPLLSRHCNQNPTPFVFLEITSFLDIPRRLSFPE
jgi:hypothetical protein